MNDFISQKDAELQAYVDDQLSVEGRRRVETYLESDQEALAQVSDYQRLNEQLKQLYDPVLAEPIPAKYLKMPKHRSGWWKPLRSLAAAIALVSCGLAAGLYLGSNLESGPLLSSNADDHIVNEAAVAYSVYTPEVRHPVEVPGEQRDHLVKWLSKRMGHQISAPHLADFKMQLLGGRLLTSDDGPGAMLMYQNINGSRIIIFACLSGKGASAFRFAQKRDISVFYWVDGAVSYAIAGEMGREELLPMAESAYHQMAF